jgi:hypothetical protein
MVLYGFYGTDTSNQTTIFIYLISVAKPHHFNVALNPRPAPGTEK